MAIQKIITETFKIKFLSLNLIFFYLVIDINIFFILNLFLQYLYFQFLNEERKPQNWLIYGGGCLSNTAKQVRSMPFD